MKIAIFSDSLPPRIDGVAKTYEKLIKYLEQEGHRFKIFSPFKPENESSWGQHVHCTPSIPFYFYPDYKISLPEKEEIYSVLDEFQPDVVHVSSPTLLGKAGLDYARALGIPVAAAFHTNFAAYFKYYGAGIFENMVWSFLKQFYNQFDLILPPSLSLFKKLESLGFRNLALWQRGVDTDLYHPKKRNTAMRKLLSPEGKPILLYVGRLVKEKGLSDLVQMHFLLKACRLASQLVIVGDGPMRNELEEKLPEARFMGYLQGKELAQIYASADIFIFPSPTETFGNVILEANASGLPVIGVNEGGVTDLIEYGQNGFLARAHAPQQLFAFVRLLLENKGLRAMMGKKGREKAEKFSWQSMNRDLLQSYRKLITRKEINEEIVF